LPNNNYKFNTSSKVSAYSLYKLAEKLFKVNLVQSSQINYLKSRKANVNDLIYLKKTLNKENKQEGKIEADKLIISNNNSELFKIKEAIFNDVYETIKKEHYEKDTISDIDLIE